MSGPDERVGTDGGEHPLDVDARFADIIAHFHDGEPSRPRLVDDAGEPEGQVGSDSSAGDPPTTPPTQDAAAGETSPPVAGPPPASPSPQAGGDDLLRHLGADLRDDEARRVARIDAEVERAVRGADGGRYVPPEPPPIPRPDLPGRLAWAGVLVGPVLLLVCALLAQAVDVPSWLVGTIVTGTVAGFGYLVWRLPRTRERDDPDDGAVV